MNTYWWEMLKGLQKCLDHLFHLSKTQPRKHVCSAFRHSKLLNGPFEVWQINFMQLPLSHGYNYALLMIWCVYTGLGNSFADRLLLFLHLKCIWKKLSLREGNFSQTS